jgi:hypothetical protein
MGKNIFILRIQACDWVSEKYYLADNRRVKDAATSI